MASSRKYRVLVAGVGSIGERHLRCFRATERAEVSLCEVHAPLRATIAERYEVARAYPDLEAALAEPHDAAVIATPAPLHVPMTRRALEAGCHVLVEKPLSTSLAGVNELAELAAAKRRTVAVGYNWRLHPALAAMRAAIHSQRFGRPVQLQVTTGQSFPTFRPAYKQIYFAKREHGGGAIQDALTHMLNLGEWILGPIDRVAADAAHRVLEGVDVEDTVNVLARHGDVLGSYSLNLHQAPSETVLTVVCTGGTARFEPQENRWRWMIEPQPNGQWTDETFEPMARDAFYITQAQDFLDAIEGRRPPACTLEEGIHTLRANLAVLAAAAEGNWQRT